MKQKFKIVVEVTVEVNPMPTPTQIAHSIKETIEAFNFDDAEEECWSVDAISCEGVPA